MAISVLTKIGAAAVCLAPQLWLFCGCSHKPSESGDPGLMRLEVEHSPADPDQTWAQVPVPPADGPKLWPVKMTVPVRPLPDKAKKPIGYLRVGAKLARSRAKVSTQDCSGGWYAVRPVGFVCADEDVTLKGDHPVVQAINVEPDRRKPMPYKYAFVRAIAPNYLRIPSKEEQFRYEMRLERHLRSYHKLKDKWDQLHVGANDVPLDSQGLGAKVLPKTPIEMDMNQRFGGNGDDSVPAWLEGDRRIPNLSSFRAPGYAIIADRIKRHAGVALIGSFVAGEAAQSRRFAVTTDARLLPADKLKADSGSPFHGASIKHVGLPVAFSRQPDASFYELRSGKLQRGARLAYRQVIPLTGRVRHIQGVRVAETRSGHWVRSRDVRTAVKPATLPSFARRGRKWIDISILHQVLTLWEGQDPVYATLVSTGRDGLGEPGKTLSTPRGTFRIYQKHITTTMDSNAADNDFELRDVPWVMYFKGGYALHAAYWHDGFGKVRSHGCVNLAPIDARYIFMWSSPEVPDHWHAAYAGDTFGEGTLVVIHE